jgi:tetratricopeptide (TPR) repeat protein
MRITIPFITLALFLTGSLAYGESYGHYDLKLLLIAPNADSGKGPAVDLRNLDRMLEDLSQHAKSYPVRFDSVDDRIRAVEDVKRLFGIFDTLLNDQNPDPTILRRAGFLYSMGHNLDIAGCAPKAVEIFEELLKILPSDPMGNQMYGAFLGGAGEIKESIPYLQKALSLGVPEAAYSLGISYIMLGEKGKALESLKTYKEKKPNDKDVDALITAIQSGKLKIKNTSE